MQDDRVQRRLAAILAGDVVGYSTMMRDDETGTLTRLKALRRELLDPKFAEFALVRMSRLSVMPVPAAVWKRLLSMGGAT